MKLPQSFLESIQQVPGFDRQGFVQVHEAGEQVTSVRINPAKWNEQLAAAVIPQQSKHVQWCPTGYYLPERPSFTLDPLLHGGAYYVQEASSMFLWQVVQQTMGENRSAKVLDLCAAPGGKSTLLASYFTDGLVVANEVIKARAAVLVENVVKWGAPNVVVTNNDPADFQKLPAFFDLMVVDAPCSGSGLFRRDSSAIEEWSLDNVKLCCQRQQRILADALDTLHPGGVLIYSTCSYSKEEDEDIADWLVEKYQMEPVRIELQEQWNVVESVTSLDAYGYRFFPDKVQGEGLYISAFRKPAGETASAKHRSFKPLATVDPKLLQAWVRKDEGLFFFSQGERIMAFPSEHKELLQQLMNKLYLRSAGIVVGEQKHKDVVPSHHLAMSTICNTNIPRYEVDKDLALQYLRKKDIPVDNLSKGWVLVSYLGVNLGWIKVLQNRANNYYPTEWRILKD